MQQQANHSIEASTDRGRVQGSSSPAASSPAVSTWTGAFIWLFIGLLVSALAVVVVMNDPGLRDTLSSLWLGLLFGQLFLIMGIEKMSARTDSPLLALALFFVLTLSMGLVLGVLVATFVVDSGTSGVATALMGGSAAFVGAAVYGGMTGRDLTTLGGVIFMGLLGLIGLMIAHIIFFPTSEPLSVGIGVAGVAIFTGLTAYDVQRIKDGEIEGVNGDTGAVMGALVLYLNFANLFLYLLSLFGEE